MVPGEDHRMTPTAAELVASETPLMSGRGEGERENSMSARNVAEAPVPDASDADEASASAPLSYDARPQSRPLRTPRRGRRLLRLLNISDPQVLFFVTVLVNVPQVLLAIFTFVLEARADKHVCNAKARAHWTIWGTVHIVRLMVTTVIAGLRWRFAPRTDEAPTMSEPTRRRAAAAVTNARNSLDAFALVWFVVGNMWLLGGADDDPCREATRSAVYCVCVAMLVVQYAQICLPCICAIAMVPVFCFCLPCVIRLLATLHDPNRGRGATKRHIAQLPTVNYYEGYDCGDSEPCCSVCISDYELGDALRVLPCKHAFHKGCVDQWLAVNATCPLCRSSIFGDDEGTETPPPRPSRPRPAAAEVADDSALALVAAHDLTNVV